MSEDAFMLSPFTTISLVGDGGVNYHLVRQLGFKRAFELSIEGHRIPAAQALEWGLVNKVTSAARVNEVALEWAQSLTKRAPLSLAHTKRVMRAAGHSSWEQSFDNEAAAQLALLGCETAGSRGETDEARNI